MTPSAELAFKETIRERDGYRCVACRMTQAEHFERYGEKLHVHRKVPGRKGGRYVEANSETRCRLCHAAADAEIRNRNTRPVKLPADVVDTAKMLCRLYGMTHNEFISHICRPLLREKIEQMIANGEFFPPSHAP